MKVRILLMRRDRLDESELEALREMFPVGTEFEFLRIDSVDYIEHDRLCTELKPDYVWLPRDLPIPVLAMSKGYRHIAKTSAGIKQLKEVVPVFVDFEP